MRQTWLVWLAGSTLVAALLPIAAIVAVYAAVQQRIVAPPRLDLRLGAVHAAAYATHSAECAPYTHCPPETSAERLKQYYVLWLIDERVTADHPYGATARRVFSLSLSR
jgi:hypothetical protein